MGVFGSASNVLDKRLAKVEAQFHERLMIGLQVSADKLYQMEMRYS